MKRFLSAFLRCLVLVALFGFLASGACALAALLASMVFVILGWAHSAFGVGMVFALLALGLAALLALDECLGSP